MSFTETTATPGLTAERRTDYTATGQARQAPRPRKKRSPTTTTTTAKPSPAPTTTRKKETATTMAKNKNASGTSPLPRRMTQQAGDKEMKKDAGARAAVKGNIGMTTDDNLVPDQRATGAPAQNVYPGFTGDGKTRRETTHATHPHIPKAARTKCQ